MATINLLPWREKRRQALKKAFINNSVAVVVFAAVIGFGWHSVVVSMIENQGVRNQKLVSEIESLKAKVTEIAELKKHRAELIARMNVIGGLQGTRPVIVHMLDEIVHTLPDGVYYKKIERKGDKFFLEGTADSNNRVSALMRKLADSDWFDAPNLTKVMANPSAGDQANDFWLQVDMQKPKQEELK